MSTVWAPASVWERRDIKHNRQRKVYVSGSRNHRAWWKPLERQMSRLFVSSLNASEFPPSVKLPSPEVVNGPLAQLAEQLTLNQ